MILYGGENVYCTEVEAVLAQHPAVGAFGLECPGTLVLSQSLPLTYHAYRLLTLLRYYETGDAVGDVCSVP